MSQLKLKSARVETLPSQLDYHLTYKPSPEYKFMRIPLNTLNATSIPIDNTQRQLEFKLPSTDVYNLARSYIGYNLALPASGAAPAKHNFFFEDVYALGSDIYFGTSGGIDLCNLKFVNNYSKVVTKMNTPLFEFLSNDKATQLYPSKVDVASNPNPPFSGAGHQTANVPYLEPQYLNVDLVANNATDKFVAYPLKNFSNTIFSYNKDLYFGNEMYVRTMTSPLNKMAWKATAAANPLTGAEDIPAATLNNVYLYLAVEQNTDISDAVKKKFHSGSYKIYIPYTVGTSAPSNAIVANINVQITKQYGKRLLQIIHSVFNNNERHNTAYDCDNKLGLKLTSYRTQLDSKYLQDYDLVCTGPSAVSKTIGNDDWHIANQKFCKDTPILNKDVYGYNWFHCDRFYDEYEVNRDADNIDIGLELKANTMNWTFLSNTTPVLVGGVITPVPLMHYTWLTFRRGYHITKDGIVPDVSV